MSNKKVLNATARVYNGIKFRSTLEVSCYRLLEESNLGFLYEPKKFLLLSGFYPTIEYYAPKVFKGKNSKFLELIEGKIRDITYTPDFVVTIKDKTFYIDTKGHPNETYPLKKKMFLDMLQREGKDVAFMEPHNVRQIKQCIDIIKEYEIDLENERINPGTP